MIYHAPVNRFVHAHTPDWDVYSLSFSVLLLLPNVGDRSPQRDIMFIDMYMQYINVYSAVIGLNFRCQRSLSSSHLTIERPWTSSTVYFCVNLLIICSLLTVQMLLYKRCTFSCIFVCYGFIFLSLSYTDQAHYDHDLRNKFRHCIINHRSCSVVITE